MAEPTAQQQENMRRAAEAFAGFRAEAPEEILERAHPDVEVFASPDLANSGSFRGHEGLMGWMSRWLDAWDEYQIDVLRMEPVGDRHVLTEITQAAKGKGSGIPVEMQVTWMVGFEPDGERYTALHLYPSWEDALREAEQREAASAG